MEMTQEEKVRRIQRFRPIDDVFFELLAKDPKVCQEMLRTILEDEDLVVNDVIVQSSERNIYGRSVRLDALCTLGDGTKCNIEVQRSDNDDHLQRVRFNASSITVTESNSGDRFGDVIDLYIVYISEFDIFGGGKTIYHVDKVLRETGTVVDDGLHEIFVNTVIDDGTDIAELMHCFMQTEVDNPKFPELTRQTKLLKTEQGGLNAMSSVMQEYIQEAVAEAVAKTAAETCIKTALKAGMSDERIIELLQEDYNLSESEAMFQLAKFKDNK